LINRIFVAFLTVSILSSCSDIEVPGVGKIVQLSCYCDSEFDKSKKITQQCVWQDVDWALSTIHESFYFNGNAFTGTQIKGEFLETNKFYRVTSKGESFKTDTGFEYETGEQIVTLDRNTLDLEYETHGFIFDYSCSIKDKQQI